MKFLIVFCIILNLNAGRTGYIYYSPSVDIFTDEMSTETPNINLKELESTDWPEVDFDLNKTINEIITNNASSMIIKKFFQPYQIVSKLNTFSSIKFSDLFVNPKESNFTYNGVLFYNISYSENENHYINSKSKLFSSKLEQVNTLSLSTSSIEISANVEVIKDHENRVFGRIMISLLNPYILEVYSKTSGVIQDVDIRLEYGETKVNLKIEHEFRHQVLTSLYSFFIEIDSHLKIDSTIYPSVILFHLDRKSTEVASKNQDSFWPHINDLFVIPEPDTQTKLLITELGLIVIGGLSNFTQVGVEVDHTENEDTINISISVGALKGILIFESETTDNKDKKYITFNFTVDGLEFQSTVKMQYRYYYHERKSYSTDIHLNVGKIEIKSKLNNYDNQQNFIDIINPKYLEIVITRYLTDSIKDLYQSRLPSDE